MKIFGRKEKVVENESGFSDVYSVVFKDCVIKLVNVLLLLLFLLIKSLFFYGFEEIEILS